MQHLTLLAQQRSWICQDGAEHRPQAGAFSRIRCRIFVRQKFAEKVRLAEYAICWQLAKFSSRKIGQKYVIRGLCASWIDVFNCWAGVEQQVL